MTVHPRIPAAAWVNTIPLLDASSLPFADDWVLLDAIHASADAMNDFEPDADRFGQFGLRASLDE